MQTIFKMAMCAALAGVMMFSVSEAQAKQLTFTNLNPVAPHFGGGAWFVAGAGSNGPYTVAQSFKPQIAGTLDYLDIPLTNVGQGAGYLGTGANVALVEDNGSGRPKTGPALEDWVVAKLPVTSPPTLKATHVTSKLHPSLSTSKTYWVVVGVGAYDEYAYWWNTTNANSPKGVLDSHDGAFSWTAYPTSTGPALDVWIQ